MPAFGNSGGQPMASSSSSYIHVNGGHLRSGLRDSSHELPARRSSEGISGAESVLTGEKRGKKGKKRGWKGWALVLEDEDGNVIDVRDGGESPPDREHPSPQPSRGELLGLGYASEPQRVGKAELMIGNHRGFDRSDQRTRPCHPATAKLEPAPPRV